jgi:hypothetical protein
MVHPDPETGCPARCAGPPSALGGFGADLCRHRDPAGRCGAIHPWPIGHAGGAGQPARELGLNDPPLTRYFNWLGGVLQGDLGTALSNGQDIATADGRRLGNTLFLAFWAAVIAVPLAIILGLLAVRYRTAGRTS